MTRHFITSLSPVRRGKHGYRDTSLENLLPHREDHAPIEIGDDRQRNPEQICASSEIGALISEQFNLLSPTLRSAFQLYHIDGLFCEEAGQNLGITVSAMKSRVSRAKRQMASTLNHVRCEPAQSKPNKRRCMSK
jgi:DNA-directed RNA polymerase specialized sigma24 family protein